MANNNQNTTQKAIQQKNETIRVMMFEETTPGTGQPNHQRVEPTIKPETLIENGFPAIEFDESAPADPPPVKKNKIKKR